MHHFADSLLLLLVHYILDEVVHLCRIWVTAFGLLHGFKCFPIVRVLEDYQAQAEPFALAHKALKFVRIGFAVRRVDHEIRSVRGP